MKKIISTALLACIASGALFASGVENKTNMSTGYLRNPSRNTETQRPEASYYNVAGTAFMTDGLFIEAGNQFVIKEYGNKLNLGVPTIDYYSNDETTVYLYPDADFVYKRNNLAIFGNFGVYAGGGSLNYTEGTSATSLLFMKTSNEYKDKAAKETNPALQAKYAGASKALSAIAKEGGHELHVTSITYGGQLGVAYKFIEKLSFAAGLRYVHGTQSMEISSDYFWALGNFSNKIKYEANGYTVSGVFGIHFKPVEIVDLAVQYQSKSSVKYEVKNVSGALASGFGITNGKTFHTDLPAALNIGAGVQVAKPVYLSASFNYYFNNFADQNSILGETDYTNSWEVAAGADIRFCKFASFSLGAQYGKQGITDDSNSSFNPVLDSFCVGTGFEIFPTENFTVTLGALFATYFDADYYLNEFYKTSLSKKVTNLSFGFTYHFPNL